jgi:hypothetical protein
MLWAICALGWRCSNWAAPSNVMVRRCNDTPPYVRNTFAAVTIWQIARLNA